MELKGKWSEQLQGMQSEIQDELSGRVTTLKAHAMVKSWRIG